MTSIARSISLRAFSAVRSSRQATIQIPKLGRRAFSGSARVSGIISFLPRRNRTEFFELEFRNSYQYLSWEIN